MVTSDNHFRHFVGLEVTWKRGAGYFDYIFFGLLPSHVPRTCLRKITPVLQVTLIIIKKIGVTRISNYYKYTCGDLFIKFTATNRKMAWLSFAKFCYDTYQSLSLVKIISFNISFLVANSIFLLKTRGICNKNSTNLIKFYRQRLRNRFLQDVNFAGSSKTKPPLVRSLHYRCEKPRNFS